MICLEDLSADGMPVFTSASCYHFFHWMCLRRYVELCRREFEEYQEETKSIRNPTEEDVFEVCEHVHVFLILGGP